MSNYKISEVSEEKIKIDVKEFKTCLFNFALRVYQNFNLNPGKCISCRHFGTWAHVLEQCSQPVGQFSFWTLPADVGPGSETSTDGGA